MTQTRFEPRALHDLPPAAAAGIRFLATDIDGTITANGAFAPELLAALARLAAAGVEPILVSGRPAGEVLGLCRYLPHVRRAVAENGLVGVSPERGAWPLQDHSSTDRERLRQVVRELSAEVNIELVEANDSFARLVDLAFERGTHSPALLVALAARAAAAGLHCIWSSVHVHFSRAAPDKGQGLLALIGPLEPTRVATIGDAPNDYGLFRRDTFALTVGTADLRPHLDLLPPACVPHFVSANRELIAFVELVAAITSWQK